jgi:hypothetical protein
MPKISVRTEVYDVSAVMVAPYPEIDRPALAEGRFAIAG